MDESLGEAFPKEIERCEELIKAYREIGPAGQFGLAFLEPLVHEAKIANRDGDIVAMVKLYPELQERQ